MDRLNQSRTPQADNGWFSGQSLLDRIFNWLGNDAAVANAHVLLEARDRDEQAIAQLTSRLSPAADSERVVTPAA